MEARCSGAGGRSESESITSKRLCKVRYEVEEGEITSLVGLTLGLLLVHFRLVHALQNDRFSPSTVLKVRHEPLG